MMNKARLLGIRVGEFGLWWSATVIIGCIGGGARGEALYPTPNGSLPREQVAQIGGYVARVDDHDIAGRGLVEVLPGCHVIVTPEQWGVVGAMSGAIIRTGRLVYVMPTKAGYRYSVDLHAGELHGPTGPISVEAYEQDASGKKTRVFPLAGPDDLTRCLEDLASER